LSSSLTSPPGVGFGLLANLRAFPFALTAPTRLATELMVGAALLEDLIATPVGATDQPVRIEVFVALDHGE